MLKSKIDKATGFEKRKEIFKHQSQKDGVVFQGADSREF
jgi:hypothetical protein